MFIQPFCHERQHIALERECMGTRKQPCYILHGGVSKIKLGVK